jgi:TonB family protein
MKNLLHYALIAILSCCSVTLLAQKTDNSEDKPIIDVEQMPQYPGGEEALMKFIHDNLKYPEASFKAGVEGRVTIRFVVNLEGAVTDVKVIRGLDSLCNNEAVRVVKMMPTWTPGKIGDRVVPIYYTLPIVFKLQKAPAQTLSAAAIRDSMINVPDKAGVFLLAEIMPQYPGGTEAMMNFIKSNLHYPDAAMEQKKEGYCLIRFVISKTGAVTNVNVYKSLSVECDAEAMRVIKLMPVWKPGTTKGIPVDVYYSIPFQFKMTSNMQSK